MTEKIIEAKWISGFWRRIAALLIDTIILGVFGYILGMVFEDIFVAAGMWGRLIGFSIALIYFGLMNSKILDGQTIGKNLLKIKVVNSNNDTIGIARSFGRYIIFSAPFFLNGAHFTNEIITSYLIYPLSFIIFGGLLSTVYLYIFNRATRQSFHDLVFGTFVVNSDAKSQNIATVWKGHLIIVFILFIVTAVSPILTKQFLKPEPFNNLLAAQIALSNDPSTTYASITTGTKSLISSTKGTSTTTYINAQIFLRQNSINDSDLARRLAHLIIDKYPEAKTSNSINITLIYGFDIGIASKWNSYVHSYDAADLLNPGQ